MIIGKENQYGNHKHEHEHNINIIHEHDNELKHELEQVYTQTPMQTQT